MTDLKSKGHWMAATFQCQLQRWRPMPPRTQLVLVVKFRFSLFAPLTASSTTRPSCYQASSSIRRLPPASLGSQRSAERYVCLSLSLAPLKKKKRGGQPHEVADSAQQTGAQRGIGTRAEADRPTACHATCTGTGTGTGINTSRPQIHL